MITNWCLTNVTGERVLHRWREPPTRLAIEQVVIASGEESKGYDYFKVVKEVIYELDDYYASEAPIDIRLDKLERT